MSSHNADRPARPHAGKAAGETGSALQHAVARLDEARARGDPEALSAALCRAAAMHWHLGNVAEARLLAVEAAACPATQARRVDALIIAGVCAGMQDNLAAGEDALQRAIDLSRESGYIAGHSLALRHLAGHVHLRRGQFDLALAMAAEADELDPCGPQPLTCLVRAWVYQTKGQPERARQALKALDRLLDPHDQHLRGLAHYIAAQLSLDEGDGARARQLLDEMLPVAEVTGHPMLRVGVRLAMSRWCRLQEEGAALEWARDAVAVARRLGARQLEAQALIARGLASWGVTDVQGAAEDLQRARTTLDELEAAYDAAHAALALSALYKQTGHPDALAAWLDAARRLVVGNYEFSLERERALALPLIASHLHSSDAAARAAAELLLGELRKIPPPALHIVALGDFSVRKAFRCIPPHLWEQRKAGTLFRFLLVQPHCSASRDQIIEALWPNRAYAPAERLLQQATWALRHVLEPELPDRFPSRYLTVADHHMSLHLPPGSSVDFVSFEHAISGNFSAPRHTLEQALALYTGPLFPLDRYADWSAGLRERLAGLHQRGLLALAQHYLEEQSPREALTCCDRVTVEDPWNEDATKIAMQSCVNLGDRPGALRRYCALTRALRRSLHLAPRADLRELAATIRLGQ